MNSQSALQLTVAVLAFLVSGMGEAQDGGARFNDLVDEHQQLAEEDKGYQSLLDAFKDPASEDNYYPCAGGNFKKRISIGFKSWQSGSRRIGGAILKSRDYVEDEQTGDLRPVRSYKRLLQLTLRDESEASEQAFIEQLARAVDDVCSYDGPEEDNSLLKSSGEWLRGQLDKCKSNSDTEAAYRRCRERQLGIPKHSNDGGVRG